MTSPWAGGKSDGMAGLSGIGDAGSHDAIERGSSAIRATGGAKNFRALSTTANCIKLLGGRARSQLEL